MSKWIAEFELEDGDRMHHIKGGSKMANRELITREEAIKTVSRWIKADMTLGSSLFEMMMNEIPTITEQDIVKPVLDKIREEIVKKHLSVMEKNDFESGRTYGYEEILEIIDKYKTESEG